MKGEAVAFEYRSAEPGEQNKGPGHIVRHLAGQIHRLGDQTERPYGAWRRRDEAEIRGHRRTYWLDAGQTDPEKWAKSRVTKSRWFL